MLNESLFLVFENWRLEEFLKTNPLIKLRNHGRLCSKIVFSVSIYPNNTTDLATPFFISQINYSSKYLINNTFYVCYYYNNDIISVKTQIDAATLKFDDVTLKIDDPSLNFGDATLNFGDATLNFDDATLNFDDASLNFDDTTLNFDDATLNFGDQTLNFGDRTLNFDDATLNFGDQSLNLDRLICFTSITN